MKTTILLIRHGETEWNILGKFQGCTDIALSEEGINQANLLRERLKDEFDCIYASPLIRALETARIISEGTGKELTIVQDIREINFGEWEGLTLKDISEKYPEIFKCWRTDKLEGKFCGGDASIQNASNRAKKCILNIVKENEGKRVAIVAHGGIIKAALIAIFGWDMTMYHKMALGNTCINKITFDADLNPVLLGLNDTNHLNTNAKTV